ncbi:hypothetical protein [Natronosalvus halobius]|uniref:hypothetical protein n=1 Tax=Natronosalvus halobius TaxID=2953746 RepID=UPI00209FFC17|nr:hypothetical protein [Natronosalvus halobius]USZ73780.1 hypothetical protein NGM15_18410 [Natronosalvus halobius]
MGDVSCAGCGTDIDTLTDTHYRVGEEERPVKSLEKAEDELEFDDFFSRGWLLCPGCFGEVVPDA